MKWSIIATVLFSSLGAIAQETATIEDDAAINIALDEINKVYIAPETSRLKSAQAGCEMVVTYNNVTEEAKAAIEYAVALWEANISTNIPVNIHVSMETLPSGVLGQGKPSVFLRNFRSAPLAGVYYPVALAEKIAGKEMNQPGEADINCNFNSNMPWYFGTDGNTPVSKYDFVSAVLHEIGHGLGISGFFKNENGISKFSNSANAPSAYDYYIFNTKEQRIADNSVIPCPSSELTAQLTSNSLLVYGKDLSQYEKSAEVFAPATWTNGVSVYHLNKDENVGIKEAETMYPYAFKGEAKHRISSNTFMVLAEIGWGYKSGILSSDVTTANNDITNQNNVNVYPNPCRNFLTIQMTANEIVSDVAIEVFNLSGKSVYKEHWNNVGFNPEKNIDLTSLEAGVYLVQTISENKKSINKIIKN
jgi:hypothetical protein